MTEDEMTDDEIDRYYCVGCEGDQRDPDHFGCTHCGNCQCEGGC